MRVSTVKYERLRNLGNFEHEKVGVEVILEEGENPGSALKRAVDFVSKALSDKPSLRSIEEAKRIIENPDDYTPRQYREAQERLDRVYDEVPF